MNNTKLVYVGVDHIFLNNVLGDQVLKTSVLDGVGETEFLNGGFLTGDDDGLTSGSKDTIEFSQNIGLDHGLDNGLRFLGHMFSHYIKGHADITESGNKFLHLAGDGIYLNDGFRLMFLDLGLGLLDNRGRWGKFFLRLGLGTGVGLGVRLGFRRRNHLFNLGRFLLDHRCFDSRRFGTLCRKFFRRHRCKGRRPVSSQQAVSISFKEL
jgi:hypothetical protein